MRVTIQNHYFDLRFVDQSEITLEPPEGKVILGECDPPGVKNRGIRIRNNLSRIIEIDTVLHEFFHGSFFGLSEDFVEQMANDLTILLAQCGYLDIEDWELDTDGNRRQTSP